MRAEKKAIVDELRSSLNGASYIILTDYRGLKSGQGEKLRCQLAKTGAGFRIVKNSFLNLALPENQRPWVADVLNSPTAVIFGSGDIEQAAKTLENFRQERRVPVVKRGIFALRVLSPAEFDILVKLPARPVLLGNLVGVIAAPMMQLAGVCMQKLSSLLYVLKAIENKKAETH